MIILGSQAMKLTLLDMYSDLGDEFNERIDKADYDVIMSQTDFSNWFNSFKEYIVKLIPNSECKYRARVKKDGVEKNYEIEVAQEGSSNQWLLDRLDEVTRSDMQKVVGLLGEEYYPLSTFYQLLTKRSHLIFPVHFEKSMSDYDNLRELCHLTYTNNDSYKYMTYKSLIEDNGYFQLRRNEAKTRYKQRTPNLNISNEDFFSSSLNVERYFIHDDIHEMVKHYETPIYEMMKRDIDKAWCEKDMFFELPFNMQVQCVQEEAYTIALERYIIPAAQDWETHYECYKKAVKRICTSLTSGWFRDFAIENYYIILSQYDSKFVEKFYKKYLDGEIKLVEGKTHADLPYFKY